MFELLQQCFQHQSSEAEFSPSVACENLYVPSLTPCSESTQQHQDTFSLQYKQERAAERESALETCVWGNSMLQYFVLCLLLDTVVLLDTSKYSLHAKMYATFFMWLHYVLVFIYFNTHLMDLDTPVYTREA